MKNLFKGMLILVFLGAWLTTISVAFASNKIPTKTCPAKTKKVFSGTAELNGVYTSPSVYPFNIKQGTFTSIRGYVRSACPMSMVLSSDIMDKAYLCQKTFAQSGEYTGFGCWPGGEETAVDFSIKKPLSNPSIFIGSKEKKIIISFMAKNEEGVFTGYFPPVIGSEDDTDLEVSVFAGH